MARRDDLGYVVGWFCGGILIVGWIVAIVCLAMGSVRRAFQAFVLPLGVVAWLFLMMEGVWPRVPDTETGAMVSVLLLFGGILLIPIVGLLILRSLSWPPRRPAGGAAPTV